MGRKFRLSHKKRYYRAPSLPVVTSLQVSIPLDKVQVYPVSIPYPLSFPLSWPRALFMSSSVENLDGLRRRISKAEIAPLDWECVQKPNMLVYYKLEMAGVSVTPNVSFSLHIESSFSWQLYYCGVQVSPQLCSLLSDVSPSLCSASAVERLFTRLSSCKPCIGNPDQRFLTLRSLKDGVFRDITGKSVVASVETKLLSTPTIRHSKCELLSTSSTERCKECTSYRDTLRASCSKQAHQTTPRSDPNSCVNYRYLSESELRERLRATHDLQRNTQKKLERLKAKIVQSVEKNGVDLDADSHGDILKMVEDCTGEALKKHPPDSFQHIFWQQQLQCARKKDQRQRRWHPLMIKWALYIRHLSGKAYDTIRESGFIALPSQRTLRDYTYFVSSSVGFSADVDKQLMEAAKIDALEEYQKCVACIMDKMHVKEDLIFSKHSGSLIGFTNLGNINDLLMQYERSLDSDQDSSPPLAKSMLVFFVRSLFTNFQFPYAQFACKSLSGDLIFSPFWQAVYRLERVGLKVIAATADGASPNRKFFQLHTESNKEYKTLNPFASDERYIYFFSDPPHLLKTVRNCLASKKRDLWCNGKSLSWGHIVKLYLKNSGSGLSLVPKLKYEHVYLTSFSKMRVDLAAQVMSSTVADALRLTGGEEAKETAHFIQLVDKFFDCLNVNNFHSGKHKRKVFQDPFRPNDFRLKWLEEDFLGYLEEWEKSVAARKGFSKTEKNKMLLSDATRSGLKFTVKAFIEMVEYLFTLHGVKCFLSERISQDPLEKFFGNQRQRGGVNENPTVKEFCQNTQALRVINTICKDVRGNCRGSKRAREADSLQENTPLKKRKTNRKKLKL